MAAQANSLPDISYRDLERYMWDRKNLSYLLWEQQLPIYNGIRSLPDDVAAAVMMISRQFGKSFCECVLATEDAIHVEDCCVPIFGPTIEQCRDIVNPRMEIIKRACPYTNFIERKKSEDKWLVGNSEIQICGFDVNSSSNRGKTVKRDAYVEEIVDSSPDKFLTSMRSDIGPALTHSETGRIVYVTTPPKIPDHPFLTEVVPQAQLDNAYYEFTIYQNKKLTRTQFIKAAKRAGCTLDADGNIIEKSIDWLREFECKVVRDASIILAPEFDEEFHVKPIVFPSHFNCWISGDSGGVRDKTVFHLWLYDFDRAKMCVFAERAFDNETPSAKSIPEVKRMEADFPIGGRRWVDVPGQTQIDWMSTHGYPVTVPRKDELEATVNQARTALMRKEVEIDPSCRLLIQTLRSGTFNRTRTDLERTSALGHCDAFMSFCYGLRHAIKTSPYPVFGDAKPHSHYIDFQAKTMPQSAKALKSIFAVK